MRIVINTVAIVTILLNAGRGLAQDPPPAGPTIGSPPAGPAVGPPPGGPGPAVELPPETDQPSTSLPRETPIENALGRVPALTGSAFGGYGQLTLNAPSNASAVVDMRQLVLFFGHSFSERIRFYSEVEIEHAIVSSDDEGEIEVEQAYLDGLLHRRFNLRGGLILMPVGIVNVFHEPTTFNGVERPDVDRLVIPSTWREPGVGFFGEIATGLRYQLYLVNGFDANGFSAEAGIRHGHQEGQLATARDFGGVLRLDYEPLLGTIFGLSGYGATAGNSLRSTVGSIPVGIVEVDARIRRRGFTARAEAAVLLIGDAPALNRALAAGSMEQMEAGPVSAQSRGGYVEAGYDLLRFSKQVTEQSLTLFGRLDYVDTQAAVPAGSTARREFERTTVTGGLVYRPVPHVGLKLDYRRHELGEGDGWNEIAAALTWMF